MFQAYGANPTPMAFSEVFTALQTGVMDGQENPLTQIYSAKFHEVQDYLSMTGHVYTPAYVLVGQNRWNSLPEDVRQILEETAKETQAYVYEQAAALESELLDKIKAESDIEVNDADKDAFIAASAPIYEDFGTQVPGGKEMIDTAISLGQGM
jgi:TRAP-type C4-dicarboxylate transport system substrate-binding protein